MLDIFNSSASMRISVSGLFVEICEKCMNQISVLYYNFDKLLTQQQEINYQMDR